MKNYAWVVIYLGFVVGLFLMKDHFQRAHAEIVGTRVVIVERLTVGDRSRWVGVLEREGDPNTAYYITSPSELTLGARVCVKEINGKIRMVDCR